MKDPYGLDNNAYFAKTQSTVDISKLWLNLNQ